MSDENKALDTELSTVDVTQITDDKEHVEVVAKKARRNKSSERGDILIYHNVDPGRSHVKDIATVATFPGSYKSTKPTSLSNTTACKIPDIIVMFKHSIMKSLIKSNGVVPDEFYHIQMNIEDPEKAQEWYCTFGDSAQEYEISNTLVDEIFLAGNTIQLLEKLPIFAGLMISTNSEIIQATKKMEIPDYDLLSPYHTLSIALTKGMKESKTYSQIKEQLNNCTMKISHYARNNANQIVEHIVNVDALTLTANIQGEGILANIVLDDAGNKINTSKIFQAMGNTPLEMSNANSVLKEYFDDNMSGYTMTIDVGSESGNVIFSKGVNVDYDSIFELHQTPNKIMTKVGHHIHKETNTQLDIHTIQNQYFIPNKAYKGINIRALFAQLFYEDDFANIYYNEIRRCILSKQTSTANFDLRFIIFGGAITNAFATTVNSPFITSIAYKLVQEFIDSKVVESKPETYMKYILPHGLHNKENYIVQNEMYDCGTSHVRGMAKTLIYSLKRQYRI